jgi:Flp pilus assembly protein TadD
MPHLRVWPRIEALGPHFTTISLDATHALVATIERLSGLTTLHLPLDITQLNVAAATIVGALSDPPAARRPSFELLLRARAVALGGFARMPEACALLHEAHTLDPADPTIAAELAAMLMRHHFMPGLFQQAFTLAPALVQQAIASAPNAAETHVAAAHLELHRGDPVVAANEFREAIACSPYLAEPHEGLGRMLLEAGFLADAVSRIEDALAIAPDLKSVKWEIARAHALEGNWGASDALVAELQRTDDRPMARLRFGLWRGNWEVARKMRAMPLTGGMDSELYQRGLAAVVDGTWPQHRDRIIELATSNTWQSRRGNGFLAGIAAETAAWCGDRGACLILLRHAAELGTFDRHWLERAPSLAIVRGTDEFVRVHRIVSDRAHAIHDALFRERNAFRDTVLGA